MRTTLKRGLSMTAVLATATTGLLLAAASPAMAFDAGPLAGVRNNETGLSTGTNQNGIQVTAPAACDPAATRHVLKVIKVTPKNASDQAAADAWTNDNLYAPVGVGLPGPLTTFSNGSIQQVADSVGQSIVPGDWDLELRCQNNFGSVIYEQWSGKVVFDSATAWHVPAAAKVSTTTSVAATPQPVQAGSPITYTATVAEDNAATPTGNVEFSVDGGAPQTAALNASGVATLTGTAPVGGSHTVSATYVGDAAFEASTGSGTFATTAVPAADTSTSLAVTPVSGPAYQSVTLSGTVANSTSPANTPAGSCDFFDGAVKVASSPVDAAGACTYTGATFGPGAHAFKATYVPTNTGLFSASESAVVPATYDQLTATPDEQSIVVTVPAGTLTIFTPYTPANPLNLGEMVLSADGKSFSASAPFNKVTVTDTRAGNPGWSASLLRANFVGANPADTIAGALSGFEGVTPSYIAGNAITAITVNDVPAGTPVIGPAQFASAAAGAGTGSVDVLGNLVLENVPTSTKAGLYTTTVTFTVG